MSEDEMPLDPFRPHAGGALDALSEAALLWGVLLDMSVEDAGTAVRALAPDDLRGLVLERVVSARLRVDFGRDGSIGFEREERQEPEGEPPDVEEPEGGWGS